MFSRNILIEDLNAIEHLRAQRDACAKLVTKSIKDLLTLKNPATQLIEDEKSAINALHDKLLELNREIQVLEEQMFFNYTSELYIIPATQQTPFPHINTIK